MAIIFAMALSWLPARADEGLTVSLITCYPGEEIYELCGHTAIRIRGEGIDSVWNYGLFNFNEPNFVYRFVKGETDYMVAGYPFRWFMPEYVEAGRTVVEQDLNLDQDQAQSLLQNLRNASLPENSKYRYNYIKDNCSTRVINQIDSASGGKIRYGETADYGSFRNEMRAYHKNYPWYQFGIDLALGSGLDSKIDRREELFVPMELMKDAGKAVMPDGRPLVKATRILNQGREEATLPPTPYWRGPLFCCWAVAVAAAGVCAYCWTKQKIARSFYFIWFTVLGIAGCLVAFLVFVSVHAATTPNALIFWLNPFQLFFSVGLCTRKLKPLAIIMALYNIVGVGVLLIIWQFIRQSANPAFFPLMGATVLLSAVYAIIELKSSYKNNRTKGRKRVAKKKK